MESNLVLYSLGYKEVRTYLIAALFIAANIVVPYLVHFIPMGGEMFLPFYLFILIGAYKYGWKMALMTAVIAPVIDSLAYNMPPMHVLPLILEKSVILVLIASYAASHFKRASLLIMTGVVIAYQVAGTLVEFLLTWNLANAMSDICHGYWGMLIQILGGYWIINKMMRK
jgi:hypothetical protein